MSGAFEAMEDKVRKRHNIVVDAYVLYLGGVNIILEVELLETLCKTTKIGERRGQVFRITVTVLLHLRGIKF